MVQDLYDRKNLLWNVDAENEPAIVLYRAHAVADGVGKPLPDHEADQKECDEIVGSSIEQDAEDDIKDAHGHDRFQNPPKKAEVGSRSLAFQVHEYLDDYQLKIFGSEDA